MTNKNIIKLQNTSINGTSIEKINLKNSSYKTKNMVKKSVENLTNIKSKVLWELKKTGFPNLGFLYSDEVLDIAPNLLEELLEEEKQKFDKKLKTKDSDISFELLNNENIELSLFWNLLDHLNYVNLWDKIEKIIDDFEPKLIEFWNEAAYSKRLYEMHKICRDNCDLGKEQKRIIDEDIKSFERRWIALDKEKQDRLKQLNVELSKLSNDFRNNVTKSKKEFEYLFETEETIKEIPEDVLKVAKQTAEDKWKQGYLFTADPTGFYAVISYCNDEKIRKEFSMKSRKFAASWDFDNRWRVLEILKLKQEKAKLLWYKNYWEFSLSDKMADSPEQIFDLFYWIANKAKQKVWNEMEELKEHFWLKEINSWDVSYYSRIMKEQKYGIKEKELKKYFEYNNTLSYLHELVWKLYWLELKEVDVNIYNKDAKVYEVYKDWELISYYLLDAFYNKNKKPWAWANNLRSKKVLTKQGKYLPLIINVCNFQKSVDGDTLLTRWDVETLFHEFGHALHLILSESDYSDLSWFTVEWDFIELPSQIHENWVSERESLEKLAKHHKSWDSLSVELLDKLDNLKTYMSWFSTLWQAEFALLDMNLYTWDIPDSIDDLDTKVLDIVNEISYFKRWEEYKMHASFNHIFGWWYSAGYYSYMWAELLEADVFEKIKDMWIFKRETWEFFMKTILWQWSRKKAEDLFKDFMWRDLDNKAFMKRKGLV